MQDNLVIFGGCGLGYLLGSVAPEFGLPSGWESIGSWGVMAIVIWFTFTRLDRTLAVVADTNRESALKLSKLAELAEALSKLTSALVREEERNCVRLQHIMQRENEIADAVDKIGEKVGE